MIGSTRAPCFAIVCLSVMWGSLFLPVSQHWEASGLADSGTPSSPVHQPALSHNASLITFSGAADRFLTLPFMIQPGMRVIQGWYYTWWGVHLGVDFINGDIDLPYSWKTFDVLAAADGEACANCIDGLGNTVWVRHKAGGRVYYTYYGHLATIEPFILHSTYASPVKVTRGQKIGTAGNTGTWYIHLHFGVYTASRAPVDPYDLYTDRSAYYPNPGQTSLGANYLFTGNPPPDPSRPKINPSPDPSQLSINPSSDLSQLNMSLPPNSSLHQK